MDTCDLAQPDFKVNPAFQQIWNTVAKVPAGKVASYGQIADLSGLPGRARLVGKALGKSPSQLALPWHRILRANGQISFKPGSEQADQQRSRLMEEGVVVRNYRIAMREFAWKPDLAALLFELQY